MKRIAYILLACLCLISCEVDKVLQSNDFSDVTFICSQIQDQYSSNIIEVDYPVSFMDLSQGVASHYWQIEDGAYFIRGEYDIELDESFDQYIIDGAGLTTSDITTFVLFKEPTDESKVSLYNSFFYEVNYYAMPEDTSISYPFEKSIGSTYNNASGLWDFEAHYTFKVIDKVDATVEIRCNDELIYTVDKGVVGDSDDSADWDKCEIEIGDVIEFKALVYGEPDTVTWSLASSLYALETVATTTEIVSRDPLITEYTATYFPTQLGDVTVGTLAMERSSGTLNNIPTGKLNKVLPLKFNVNGGDGESLPTPSIQVDDFDCVTLYFTSLLATLPNNVADDFTIHVKNSKLTEGSTYLSVASASLNSNSTAVVLNLQGNIYSDDEIEIVYTGDSDPIKDRTGGSLANFTIESQKLQFFDTVVCDPIEYGFEGTVSSDKIIDGWFIYTFPTFSYSEEEAYTGIRSLKFESSEASSDAVKGCDGYLTSGEAGDYVVEAYVLKKEEGVFDSNLYFNLSIATGAFYSTTNCTPNIADIPDDEWTKVRYTFTTTASIVSTSKIVVYMPGDVVGTLYIDDITVYRDTERPE